MNKTELIDLVNQKLDDLAAHDELLVLSDSFAHTNAMGMKITQETQACVMLLENESFSEAASFSTFLKSANRIYDDYQGKVTMYQGKNLESLKKADPEEMDYDKAITVFGKLNHKHYFVHPLRIRPKDMIHETYLAQEEEGAKKVNGVIVHEINESSVSKISLDGNIIKMTLKPKYSHTYFSVQVKNNAGFEEYPDIEEATLEMTLNNEGNLVSMVSHDKYNGKMGFFPLSIEMDSYTNFIVGKDMTFKINGQEKKLHVPAIDEFLDIYPPKKV